MMYVVFYLLVLDPAGCHVYVCVSPRTNLCILVYLGSNGLLIMFFYLLGGTFIWYERKDLLWL